MMMISTDYEHFPRVNSEIEPRPWLTTTCVLQCVLYQIAGSQFRDELSRSSDSERGRQRGCDHVHPCGCGLAQSAAGSGCQVQHSTYSIHCSLNCLLFLPHCSCLMWTVSQSVTSLSSTHSRNVDDIDASNLFECSTFEAEMRLWRDPFPGKTIVAGKIRHHTIRYDTVM